MYRYFIALLLLAATAQAQGPWIKGGQWVYSIPNPLPMGDGFARFDPSEADFIATGARRATDAEIAAQALIAQEAAQVAEAQRQLDKPLALKTAENNFFKLCFSVFGNMQKRGFAELRAALDALKETDAQAAIVASLQLLAIDAEAKREGGLEWWDDATYHTEIEQ